MSAQPKVSGVSGGSRWAPQGCSSWVTADPPAQVFPSVWSHCQHQDAAHRGLTPGEETGDRPLLFWEELRSHVAEVLTHHPHRGLMGATAVSRAGGGHWCRFLPSEDPGAGKCPPVSLDVHWCSVQRPSPSALTVTQVTGDAVLLCSTATFTHRVKKLRLRGTSGRKLCFHTSGKNLQVPDTSGEKFYLYDTFSKKLRLHHTSGRKLCFHDTSGWKVCFHDTWGGELQVLDTSGEELGLYDNNKLRL